MDDTQLEHEVEYHIHVDCKRPHLAPETSKLMLKQIDKQAAEMEVEKLDSMVFRRRWRTK
jgi:hypothetical protein